MVIQVLTDEVINQIAAGEVVERPSSVVKELLENALDAGSTRIEVYVNDGGKELIRVVDDGSGIPQDSLELAVTRHATSKINTIADLENIGTMGFRGEALASIASVSRLTLVSRTAKSDYGYEITIENGKRGSVTKAGVPVGTDVRVSNLFSALPARQKFLKSSATETKYISQLVTSMALAHPNITFRLVKDDKELFYAPTVSSLKERVQMIWGDEFFSQVVPIFFEHPYLGIEGFVGKPQIASKTASGWLFVNRRWVDDRPLQVAVRDAYGGLLPPKARPFFIIAIKTPGHLVDVNVHPRKEEVRFASPAFVFNTVRTATQKALFGADLTPLILRDEHVDANVSMPGRSFDNERPRVRDSGGALRPIAGEYVADIGDKVYASPLPWESPTNEEVIGQARSNGHDSFLVFQQVYIIDSSEDEVVVYDQHALHERVLFERFKNTYKQGLDESEIQALLIPQQIQLSPDQLAVFEEHVKSLEKLGFRFRVKGRSVIVESVPVFMKDRSFQHFLPDVLDDWSAIDVVSAQEDLRLSYLACRSAVKAGDTLGRLEIGRLLKDAKEMADMYTCPHGRPFKVKITRKELDTWFKRTGFD